MSTYANIRRCLELTERDIASAVGERHLTKALLDQLAKVSRPDDGASKLLLVFARMTTASVEWIDGGLRVEMNGEGETTAVQVLSELGAGMRERVFPAFKMGVPLGEFVRAVERVPHMIAPLMIATFSEKRLVFTAATDGEDSAEGNALGRAAVSIDDESLYTANGRRSKAPERNHEAAAPPNDAKKVSKKSIRPKVESVRPRAVAPHGGKTLRPAAAPMASITDTQQFFPAPPPRIAGVPAAPRISPAPSVVPRAPPLPRTDDRTPQPSRAPGARRSVVARVPLAKVQVIKTAPAPAQGAKPPKRASVKPEAVKAPSKAPPRNTKPPPKAHAKRETPDEDEIDGGWDD